MKLIDELKRNRLITSLASVKITCACLFLLFVLTFWGTIAQINNGLFAAQQRFFHSYVFFIWGFLPFPGAQLVLWVLFINLLSVTLVRFVYRLTHIGIIIIHFGLLIYFVAAYLTLHQTIESTLTLREGQGSNLSESYNTWELSLWTDPSSERQVMAIDMGIFKPGDQISFGEGKPEFMIAQYYPNAEAYQGAVNGQQPINSSGISALKEISPNKEPVKNFPGLLLMTSETDSNAPVLLYGAESRPTAIKKGGKEYFLQLRRKRWPLPFFLTLKDFHMEQHPNTEVARMYQSQVQISHDNVKRDILISMNEPLRYKNFTLYQASYSVDALGRESSTLAVVKHFGRLLPYIASLTTFAGLVIHFLTMAFVASFKKARMRL